MTYLNIDHPYFEKMVGQIYPTEFFIVSSKIYDNWDDFSFEIVNFIGGEEILWCIYLFIFRSLFVFREYVLMLLTSTAETYFDG